MEPSCHDLQQYPLTEKLDGSSTSEDFACHSAPLQSQQLPLLTFGKGKCEALCCQMMHSYLVTKKTISCDDVEYEISFQPSGVPDFDSYAIPLFWFLLHLYFCWAHQKRKKRPQKNTTKTPTLPPLSPPHLQGPFLTVKNRVPTTDSTFTTPPGPASLGRTPE